MTTPSPPELRELRSIATAAARAACELLRGARPREVRGKGNPRDLVTEWDTRAEARIREVLEALAPGVPVLGEEGGQPGGAAGPPGPRWLVDPIDGTVNFAHGLPLWCVAIALEVPGRAPVVGEPVVGVVVAPALDWWFTAARGLGAHDGHGAPLAVSAVPRLDGALLSTGFPYDRATHPDNNFAAWEQLQRTAGACRRLGAAALDLCLVARGDLDGYWERRIQPWDLAAGALIVREAGGVVTDTRGRPFDPHAGDACASNGAIHEELISALGRARASEGEPR